MTVQQAYWRGFNLMATAFIFLTGLAFASGGIREDELIDKLDDLTLLGLGIVLLVWYLIGENRYKRSWVPVIIVVLALVPVQLYGLLSEIDDKEAIGNDIGGMFIYVPLVIFTLYQFLRPPKFT